MGANDGLVLFEVDERSAEKGNGALEDRRTGAMSALDGSTASSAQLRE